MLCSIDGCKSHAEKLGMCSCHYAQVKYFGGIKHKRTEPNEYEIIDGVVYVTFYDRHHNPMPEKILIEEADYPLIAGKRLTVGYVKTGRRVVVWDKQAGTNIRLNRLIMGEPEGMDVDHKNRNQIDNRRSNLRVCDRTHNNMNRLKKGYSLHSQNGTYSVEIKVGDKRIRKHGFKTEEDAKAARIILEKELFGEFAPAREAVNA
jgi:hypothetical protein